MTYAEFLASQGATPDDIKVLDHPVARKAWEKQQADAVALAAERDKFKKTREDYDKWYSDEAVPATQKAIAERDVALANLAAEKAANAERLKLLSEAGLIEVARQAGEPSVTPTPDAFDPKKHNLVDLDTLKAVADREGEAIAIMADIQDEHRELFGTRINARELRREALAQNKSVEQLWMEKYNVPAKRTEREVAAKAAHDKKVGDEAVSKFLAEHPQSNPNLVAPVVSSNPFARKPDAAASGTTPASTMPWARSESEAASSRVEKALRSLSTSARPGTT